MASRLKEVRIVIGGGWAPDFGPVVDAGISADGSMAVPFLAEAENCIFELDGAPHKIPGITKLFAGALESGAKVRGLFDWWRIGTGGSPSQHRVIHVGKKIKNDDGDGSFSDLFTALDSDSIPAYAVLEDLLIIAQTGNDVPRSWDGTTAQNLAGSPPNFAFHVEHKNRVWAAGDPLQPGRLYYSTQLDGADWIGSGSGSIDLSPLDGDRITGLISHKNDLWIFKGPYAGSIHRIAGSAPTGSDGFVRTTFVNGLGAASHRLIFRFRDDIGFVTPGGTIHSLKTTAAFGDFDEGALSLPLNRAFCKERISHAQLSQGDSANSEDDGCVQIAIPADGKSANSVLLCMDYRFEPVRWTITIDYETYIACLARVIDASSLNRPITMCGGEDGFVRKMGQSARSIDGSGAIAMRVWTPHLTYGSPMRKKVLMGASVGISPKGDYNGTLGWQRDEEAAQTETFDQRGANALGGSLSSGSITAFADAGGGLVTVTSATHGLSAGDRITIFGTTSYNGVFEIQTVPTANTYTIIDAFVSDDATGTWQFSSVTGFFVLDTSRLGGFEYIDKHLELLEGGEFHALQLRLENDGANEDLEVHALTTLVSDAGLNMLD